MKISNVSSILPCNGGIPQGTKLGPVLLHGGRVGETMASTCKVRGRPNHLRDHT